MATSCARSISPDDRPVVNWDDLRVFLAVARAERLSAAAIAVGQNATTVSRRLKRLEALLERRLFELTPSGHVLTEQGRHLLEQAERMEAAALGVERADAAGADLAGSIRISASEGFGSRIIAPRLCRFHARHPHVQVDLIASTGFLNPSRREADLAVMLARPKSGAVMTRRLTDYRLGLYGTASYLARSGAPLTLGDIGRHPLVGYVHDQIYAPELRYLEEIGPKLRPGLCSTSINAQAEIVASGAGLGILPCFLADQMPALARVLPDVVDITRSFWLVVPPDLRGIARIDRFVDWLDQEIAQARPMMLGRPDR